MSRRPGRASARLPLAGFLAVCLGLGSCNPGSGSSAAEPDLGERGAALAAELSERQLIGQRILLSFDGTELPPVVGERLRRGFAPGVVLFDHNYSSPAQLRELTSQIQRAASAGPVGLPALVMVDQEGGQVRRLPGPPRLSAAAMGKTLAPAQIAEQGRLTGELLAGLGVNADLAPVADLGLPGGALAGEDRAFAADPAVVSGAAEAFADGLAEEGVAATAKHFPGFGSADVNTDQGAAIIDRSAAEEELELAPFRSLVDGGVPLVMLSTAVYPAHGTAPAALVPAVAQDLLRGELGFAGVSVTDALDTPALAAYAPPAQVAAEALAAPADLLLYAHSTQASLDASAAGEAALAQGALTGAELRPAAARILTLRLALEDAASLADLIEANSE